MKKQLLLSSLAVIVCFGSGCGKSGSPSGSSDSSTPAPNSPSNPAPGSSSDSSGAASPSNAAAAQALSQDAPSGQSGSRSGAPADGPVSGAVQNPAPAAEPPRPIVVPAGTAIPVILSSTLNSRTSNAGDEFEGSLASPVLVDGQEAIPKGASVTGTVVTTKAQGKFKGPAILTVKLVKIRVRGKPYPIASRSYSEMEKGKGKRTAVVTGGGAALGALIGGLAGGGKGAAIGAGVGGGGGLAASGATGGKNITLPAESRIIFRLADSLTLDPQ
jgi:hypothetical protein